MDKYIALFLLKLFSSIWQRYFQANVSAGTNNEVQARYTTLRNAVLANNIPDISWAKVLKYLRLDDNSVVSTIFQPQKSWTEAEWTAAIAEKQRIIGLMQNELIAHQDHAAMVQMDQECIARQESDLADMQGA